MKRKEQRKIKITSNIVSFFLLYLIGSLLLDYLLGIEFPFENTLISSTGFAIVMTFISAYKKAKNGYYFKRPPQKK